MLKPASARQSELRLGLRPPDIAVPPRGTPFGISVALHLLVFAGLVWVMGSDPTPPRLLFKPPTRTLVYMPVVPMEIPTIKLAALRAPEPIKAEEPAPVRPVPEPAPVFENRRAEAARPIELPVEPPPAPAPPAPTPKRAEVTVGAFASPVAPPRTPEPVRQIEIAGFDRNAAPTAEITPAQTSVGAFDRAAGANSKPAPSADTVIADSGFNRSAVVQSTAPNGRVVRDTGFGNTNSREQPREALPAEVKPVAFDTVREAKPITQAAAAAIQARVVPVEVLFKPVPVYTDEARKRRIEGDVLLEVEFSSAGSIRVLRVVRGLGHGLDEAAIKAAEQIRFKPAQASGRSVDSRATVNIVFRLA